MLRKVFYTASLTLSLTLSLNGLSKAVLEKTPVEKSKVEISNETTKEALKVDKKKEIVKAPVRATGSKIEVGKQAPLLKENASKLVYVKGKKAWTHADLEQGKKISVLFYAAPSAKDLNRHVSSAITAANMSRDFYDSYAVVNMKASGWPNFIIAMKLKKSQEEFPYTKYVRDNKKMLVNEWGLKDKSNDVLLFDTDGTVLFRHDGKVPEAKAKELVKLMKEKVQSLEKAAQKKAKEAEKKKSKAELPAKAAASSKSMAAVS